MQYNTGDLISTGGGFHLKICRHIATGSSCNVYKVSLLSTHNDFVGASDFTNSVAPINTYYALKTYNSDRDTTYMRELSHMKHSSVYVANFTSIDGYKHILMKYLKISAGDLAVRLAKLRKINSTNANIIAKTCGALIMQELQKIHNHGIVHYDISSGNIMFEADWFVFKDVMRGAQPDALLRNLQVHIIDFGNSFTQKSVNVGLYRGTNGYIAPEVLCGESPSFACDVWSASIVVLELFINRPLCDIYDFYSDCPARALFDDLALDSRITPDSDMDDEDYIYDTTYMQLLLLTVLLGELPSKYKKSTYFNVFGCLKNDPIVKFIGAEKYFSALGLPKKILGILSGCAYVPQSRPTADQMKLIIELL